MKFHTLLYVVTTALGAASANADVYKCGNGAKAVYQQHPCENAPNKPPLKIKDISKERQLEAQKQTNTYLAEEEQRRKTEQAERDKERALQIEEAKAKELSRQTNAIREQTEALRNAPAPNTYTSPYMPFYRYPYDQRDIPRRRHEDWSGQEHSRPHEQGDGREQPNRNEQWWMNPKHDMNDQWWIKKRR